MLANALPPVLQPPVVAPTSHNAASSGNGPESFARMLDAADARRQAQAAADKAPEASPASGRAADNSDAAVSERTEAAATQEAASGESGVKEEAKASADTPLPPDPALGSDAAALLAGLAALPRPAQAETIPRTAAGPSRSGLRAAAAGVETAAAEAGARRAPEATDGASSAPGPDAAPARSAAADGKGEDFSQLIRQGRGAGSAAEQAADTRAGPQAAAASSVEAPSQAAETPVGAALPMLAAAAGALPGSPGASAAAPAHARLGASPGSPEFANQLGAQLSTFVREGVQHARLELHPLELGPVTVQIALDGTLARVNMAAEHASTRQALEQAMPALAGSLREAGLTLSGGGVFEQPRQPQPDGGAAGSGAQRERRGEPGTSTTGTDRGEAPLDTAPLRRRGVVDLVA